MDGNLKQKKVFVQTMTKIYFWRAKVTIDLIIVVLLSLRV
jgi:hypothetical protein